MITGSNNDLTAHSQITHPAPLVKVKNLLWGCVGIGCALIAAKLTADFIQGRNPINPLNQTNTTQPVCLPSEKNITTNLAQLFCLPSERNTTIDLAPPSFAPLNHTNMTQPLCLPSEKSRATLAKPLTCKFSDKSYTVIDSQGKSFSLKLPAIYSLVHSHLKAVSSMIKDIFFNESCANQKLSEKHQQLLNSSESSNPILLSKIRCNFKATLSYDFKVTQNEYLMALNIKEDAEENPKYAPLLSITCGSMTNGFANELYCYASDHQLKPYPMFMCQNYFSSKYMYEPPLKSPTSSWSLLLQTLRISSPEPESVHITNINHRDNCGGNLKMSNYIIPKANLTSQENEAKTAMLNQTALYLKNAIDRALKYSLN